MPPVVALIIGQLLWTVGYLILARNPRLWQTMVGNLMLLITVAAVERGAYLSVLESRQVVWELHERDVELKRREEELQRRNEVAARQAIAIGTLISLRERMATVCR